MSLSTQLQCGAVNIFATTFLPQQHVRSFCSAWLQKPIETVTSTRLATASPITVTRSLSLSPQTITTTETRTERSTVTSTSDSWRGTPACSTVPTFERIRARTRKQPSAMSRMLDQACQCIDMPASTSTIVHDATHTPVVEVTAVHRNQPRQAKTATTTELVTSTREIFLADVPTATPAPAAHHSVYESGPEPMLEKRGAEGVSVNATASTRRRSPLELDMEFWYGAGFQALLPTNL